MRLGYCFSGKEGLVKMAEDIVASTVSVAQFYPGSPQSYFPTARDEGELDALLAVDVDKYVHLNFFVNLAVDKGVHRKSLFENLKFVEAVGAKGLIVHMGANEDVEAGMEASIKNLEGFDKILIENMCGGERLSTEKLFELVDKIGAGFCFDTAHAYGEGIGYSDIVNILTTKNIDLVHLNNPSRDVGLGSGRDKHNCSLFEGVFDTPSVLQMASICARRNIPMVLETGDEVEDYNKILAMLGD